MDSFGLDSFVLAFDLDNRLYSTTLLASLFPSFRVKARHLVLFRAKSTSFRSCHAKKDAGCRVSTTRQWQFLHTSPWVSLSASHNLYTIEHRESRQTQEKYNKKSRCLLQNYNHSHFSTFWSASCSRRGSCDLWCLVRSPICCLRGAQRRFWSWNSWILFSWRIEWWRLVSSYL